MKFARISYEIRTKFVRISYEFGTNLPSFPLFRFVTALKAFAFFSLNHVSADYVPVPQPGLAPLPRSRHPRPLPSPPRRPPSIGGGEYGSGALGVDDVVGWAASLDPSPEVIHIDMRSPTRNSYLGGRGWATTLWRELRHQLPSLKFLHLTPLPSSVDQLLNSMRTNPVGKPKDAHVQVYPTTNLVHTPPPLRYGVPAGSCCRCTRRPLFFPFLGTLPTPGAGMIWASPLSIYNPPPGARPRRHPPHLL